MQHEFFVQGITDTDSTTFDACCLSPDDQLLRGENGAIGKSEEKVMITTWQNFVEGDTTFDLIQEIQHTFEGKQLRGRAGLRHDQQGKNALKRDQSNKKTKIMIKKSVLEHFKQKSGQLLKSNVGFKSSLGKKANISVNFDSVSTNENTAEKYASNGQNQQTSDDSRKQQNVTLLQDCSNPVSSPYGMILNGTSKLSSNDKLSC